MSDSRHRDADGPLARARRFLGRVIETVRGAEPPPEQVPGPASPTELVVPARAAGAGARPPDLEHLAVTDLDRADERVVELPADALAPSLESPASTLLADASWSGLRAEDRGEVALLAWRAAEGDTLRVVEVRCDFGALDAEPRITVTDEPASGVIGARSLVSDAARIVVAIGALRDGTFVSSAHAAVR